MNEYSDWAIFIAAIALIGVMTALVSLVVIAKLLITGQYFLVFALTGMLISCILIVSAIVKERN